MNENLCEKIAVYLNMIKVTQYAFIDFKAQRK